MRNLLPSPLSASITSTAKNSRSTSMRRGRIPCLPRMCTNLRTKSTLSMPRVSFTQSSTAFIGPATTCIVAYASNLLVPFFRAANTRNSMLPASNLGMRCLSTATSTSPPPRIPAFLAR